MYTNYTRLVDTYEILRDGHPAVGDHLTRQVLESGVLFHQLRCQVAWRRRVSVDGVAATATRRLLADDRCFIGDVTRRSSEVNKHRSPYHTFSSFAFTTFLPRDAVHKRGCMPSCGVRPSVCLSVVTYVDSVETNKHIFDIVHRRVVISF